MAGYSLLVWALVAVGLAETRPAGTRMSTTLPFVRYGQIAAQRRFIVFALVNTGAMAMALTYVSLSSQVLMGEGGLSPLGFSMVFGANGFWIMLASVIANRVIRKMGRPTCLTLGTVLMALGSLTLVLSVMTAPTSWQTHWLSYMLPVATACAGLAFLMGPATSYALEPFAAEAGVASALNGFVQMAGAAAVSLSMMALPLAPRLILALVMLLGAIFAFAARLRTRHVAPRLSRLTP